MQSMKFELDDKPGLGPLLLYGLQWWIISLPSAVIMGVIVSRLHFGPDVWLQTVYMQKIFGLMGLVTIIQVLWGHRLPLVVGPATILLVGITASSSSSIDELYTAMCAGGAALAVLAYSGLLSRLRLFFTPRIVSIILILIAVTLTPTILRLVSGNPDTAARDASFAVLLVFFLLLLNKLLPGIWKSMTVLAGLFGGSFVYFLLDGFPVLPESGGAGQSFPLLGGFAFDPGTVLSFLFCYLALLINELGSVESIGQMLKVDDTGARIKHGAGIQGLANMAAGGLGVIGSVDYSMSAGVIAATGCASRYTLIPAGAGLALCAFFPGVIQLLSCIPAVVMGALMLYLMSTQMASGLSMLVARKAVTDFNSGVTVALPLMIGLVVAFAPPVVTTGMPELLRPILGNGFVMGTIAVIVLEHVVFAEKKA